jgi:penicillin-binding protein 2
MGGVWYRPHLVNDPAHAEQPRRAQLNPDNVARIVSGMYGVVNEGGTGGGAALAGVRVCGKTGTAQRASNDALKSGKLGQELKDNGWFVGFAPCEAPEIVVVTLFEGGVSSAFAAPIARDVMKAYFDKKARMAEPKQLAIFNRPGR